jgi:hypothetical protein
VTVYSQNMWSANDRGLIASYSLPGGKVALRAGDVSVVLLWVANQWHQTVEPLVWPGVWGYAERTVRGSSTTLSNHASGTAIDLNAPAHPLGVAAARNFTAAQIAQIRRIADSTNGAVRWGGDYDNPARGGVAGSRPDPMHMEIVGGAAVVKAAADRMRGGAATSTSTAIWPEGDDLMQAFEWPAGVSAHKLVCPVGSASQLVDRAWFSMACDGEISKYDVWFQGDQGGLKEYHGAVGKDRRAWWELPSGTTQIVVHIVATGPVGAALETKPR